jgi:hypothetical protein
MTVLKKAEEFLFSITLVIILSRKFSVIKRNDHFTSHEIKKLPDINARQ